MIFETEGKFLPLPLSIRGGMALRPGKYCQKARQQCQPRRDDPWLLGYFLANEPPFTQKELQTVQMILDGPATATRAGCSC